MKFLIGLIKYFVNTFVLSGAAGLASTRPPLVHGTGGVRGQQQLYEKRHQPAQGGEQAERD